MCHIQLCIDPRFSSIQKMSCHLRKHASVFSLKTEAKNDDSDRQFNIANYGDRCRHWWTLVQGKQRYLLILTKENNF